MKIFKAMLLFMLGILITIVAVIVNIPLIDIFLGAIGGVISGIAVLIILQEVLIK